MSITIQFVVGVVGRGDVSGKVTNLPETSSVRDNWHIASNHTYNWLSSVVMGRVTAIKEFHQYPTEQEELMQKILNKCRRR